MNDYEDPNPDPDSGEIDEEEPDVDYVDGEPVSGNIADKDDEIKDELWSPIKCFFLWYKKYIDFKK